MLINSTPSYRSRKYAQEAVPLAVLKAQHDESLKKAKDLFRREAGYAIDEPYAQGARSQLETTIRSYYEMARETNEFNIAKVNLWATCCSLTFLASFQRNLSTSNETRS